MTTNTGAEPTGGNREEENNPDALLKKILKPGAVLTAVRIDPNDPEFKKSIEESRRQQRESLARKNVPFRNYRITI